MPQKPKDPVNEPPERAAPAEPTVPRQRVCGTMLVHRRLLTTNPDYVRARAASENRQAEVRARRAAGLAQARTGVTVIPIVVHVVHNTAAQNISDAQIQSQIQVLNRDFRMTNPDVASLPGVFSGLAADARIEFRLATTDPSGNPTNGITRTPTSKATFDSETDDIKFASSGGHDAWPAGQFLNVWTAPRLPSPQGDLLGYAQFPGGPAATDGVVILHSAFGTTGTAAAPFNLGRTTTHEIGHYLNLRHIWGDDGSGCNGSDFVNDTPNQAGPNFGTPAFPHVSCMNGPNGDLFMNYMDYVDDAAMFMFTAQQVDRMQATLDADRSTIGSTLPAVATTPATDVTTTTPSLDLGGGPTSPLRDVATTPASDLQTLPQLDIQATLKFRDDPITLKFRDDPITLKFRDDPITIKFTDDGGGGTLKNVDDVKLPLLDKPPSADVAGPGGPGFPPQPGPIGGGRATPFVLSTPHHSMAWTQSFPQAARQTAAAYEQQLQQYQQLLNEYASADAAGQLLPNERQQAEALYEEYMALMAQYRATFGG
jgi:hypothetical protein